MQLIQLFVQVEAAHDTVDELGKLGLVEFRDLNPEVSAFQKNFVNEVRRCEDMERRVRFFEEVIQKEKQDILADKSPRDKETLALLQKYNAADVTLRPFNELETQFEELEKELLQLRGNQEVLDRNFNELTEMKYVLTKDAVFFSEAVEGALEQVPLVPEDKSDKEKVIKIGFYTGAVKRDKFFAFNTVLWRSLRGNMLIKYAELEDKIRDPSSFGDLVHKTVFIVFYQGERAQLKIKRICDSFGATTYQIPETPSERKNFLGQVETRLADLKTVIGRSQKHRRQVYADMAKHLPAWREKVIKEKSIYDSMNMFNYDVGRKCLIAEGWCPKNATEKVVGALRVATESSGALVPSIMTVIKSREEPPTYFKLNKFTRTYHGIIATYGIAHYREVNPAAFTLVTFPFLFGVMFGDFGHGILLTLFALFLVIKEKQIAEMDVNEMVKMVFGGRYLLLLMGFFSIYAGLLYNEFFSMAMNIFGTRWEWHTNSTSNETWATPTGVYAFGVDPAWNGAPNALDYYNSLKMKMSVLIGISQMTLGLFLSLINALHFRHYVDIVGEFIPQLLFLMCLFGYMCFLIIYKWVVNWNNESFSPPFIMQIMIFMFLSPTSVTVENGTYMFPNQKYLQWVFVLTALICVPWMLLSKPLYLRWKFKNKTKYANMKKDPHDSHDDHDEHEEELDFGEVMVKQIIHTIEFVLNSISNTASYLRLWALSLAHSELSEVFWDLVLVRTLKIASGNWIIGMFAVFIGFGIWAAFTVAVLLVMESLSAFLHALRLHWVEFCNKFYHGDGREFVPFSYEVLLAPEEE